MDLIQIPVRGDTIPTFVATPAGSGPWPGVVVVHDALGMTPDLEAQAMWLAEAGFVAAAPDLFHDGGHLRCLFRTMREMTRPDGGPARRALLGVRDWLLRRADSNGAVGIIGFCLGGGFAFALASGHDFSASAPSYGAMTEQGWASLADACPIVASYGADDPTLAGDAARLERVLTELEIPHDVREYPGVGHGFMNDHGREDVGLLFRVLIRLSHTKYDEAATADARRRIVAFFGEHLRGAPTQ
ncbi:MAG: dienelactone hydrolase family protein [Myxococcales bacterium]|nr:dienelactone hydrolase family protein [Myxococcales bacterium]